MQALYIVYNDSDNTNIPIIDEQHRGIISIINTFFFHKADAKSDIDKFLVPSAEMLKHYASLHFLTLERLMAESSYPYLEEEEERHKSMMKEIQNTDIKYRAARDADGFLNFLKKYWHKHACKPDSGYIKHIKTYLCIKDGPC